MWPGSKTTLSVSTQKYFCPSSRSLEWRKTTVMAPTDMHWCQIVVNWVSNSSHCAHPLSDDFSCLSGKIFLSRSLGYNLLQSYIPTSLIVMISWVSFWIDRRAVPARVTLSFTTLVSFTTLGSGLRIGAQVSYAKALDIWSVLLFVLETVSSGMEPACFLCSWPYSSLLS